MTLNAPFAGVENWGIFERCSVLAEQSFIEQWSLTFDDLEFVNGYRKTMRIWVAIQLKFFCLYGYFPTDHSDIIIDCTAYLAGQMGCSVPDQSEYHFKARATRHHNQDVLRHLGFRRATDRDKAADSPLDKHCVYYHR